MVLCENESVSLHDVNSLVTRKDGRYYGGAKRVHTLYMRYITVKCMNRNSEMCSINILCHYAYMCDVGEIIFSSSVSDDSRVVMCSRFCHCAINI